jgi:hypothetical protein
MTDLKPTTILMTPRRGFFTRVAGVMALGVAAIVPTAPRADTEQTMDRIGLASWPDAISRCSMFTR